MSKVVLDEKSLRKPGFDEANSVPVFLPGGQAWFLPRPVIYLTPVFKNGKRVDDIRFTTDDPEFDRLRDAVTQVARDEDGLPGDFGGAVESLAVYMLLQNYDMTDEQIGMALRVKKDGPTPDRDWITEVIHAAFGQAPKASAVG